MSKWFESANLANYAKTALLQAQKQIDKVLDIKEDEIIGKIQTTTNDNIDFTINDQLTNNKPFTPPPSLPAAATAQIENDFFSTFLNNNIRSSSPLIDESSSSITSNRKLTKSKTSSTSSITILKEPEIEFDTFLNQENNNNLNKSSNSSNSLEPPVSVPVVETRQTKSNAKALNKQLEIEKLEKKNWIQNYVDSNGGNDTTTTTTTTTQIIPTISSSCSSSTSTSSTNVLQQQASLIEDDTNKTVINESIEQYQQQIIDENMLLTSLNESFQKVNESCHSNSTTNNECLTIETTLVVDTAITTTSIAKHNLSEDQSIIKIESIQGEGGGGEAASPTSSNGSSIINDDKNNKLGNEYVKVDSSTSINSGHASSAEEHETCASSDIEVISLPSTNGDQLLRLKKNQKDNNHFQSPLIIINKKVSNHKPKEDQITYIKSPPPDNQADHSATSNILEAREIQILKLNKQNVKLQEENDNILNELEKLKFESIERFKIMQQAQTDLNLRCEQFHNENEKLKKINADLNREFIEFQKQLKEKDEQIEQLKQEGLKLSKQELNQSNIIKKLRTKEKENDESLQILRTDNVKLQKELDELKKILDLKEESEKQSSETFKKLEKGAAYLEKELTNAKSLLEDSQEKVTSLENTLQNTFKELAELHRLNAAKDSRINEATSSIENQFKEEIQIALDKERLIANKKQESLKWELQV
jgi:TATA element modulatory factor